MKWRCILLVLFCSYLFKTADAQQTDSTMFYFAAHQDDWQLFMSANAWNDAVVSKCHVVFITITAGDSGHGDEKFGTGFIPYYQARENGAILSAKFMADVNSAGKEIKGDYDTINDHKVFKYVYKNLTCYFLRLPNVHDDGNGYVKTNHQSLKKLRDGNSNLIQSVDGASDYTSWDDLTKTLVDIINKEKGTAKSGWINITDTDKTINKNDHSEHILTGVVALDAVKNLAWLGVRAYVDYYSQSFQPNLSTDQVENAAALHACDVIGMINGGYPSNWNDEHKAWLPMDYFRIVRKPL